MRRRVFLAGAAGLAATAGLPLAALQAGRGCYRLEGSAVICATGFVDTPDIAPEPCRPRCWATCLAYVLSGYGARVDTRDVLAHGGMTEDCAPGDDGALIRASAGVWRDRAGREFLLDVSDLAPFSDRYPSGPGFTDLLDRLGRQPVLCGSAGHTTVVTEITTIDAPMSGFRRERVVVRDPYVASHGLRPLGPAELATRSYVLGITIRAL
jgi:hypothetical protein